MKEPYPLCQKHGVSVDHERGYVSWPEWKRWMDVHENKALMDVPPKHVFSVTVCEWGIPACDVEMWLAMATKARTVSCHEMD